MSEKLNAEERALLARAIQIHGDGNIVGDENRVNVNKIGHADYEVNIIGGPNYRLTLQDLLRIQAHPEPKPQDDESAMPPSYENSIFQVTSQISNNGDFGTAFVIHTEHRITYLLTCAHVVTNCEEQVQVAGRPAEVLKCDFDWPDLALLKVPCLPPRPALPLSVFAAPGDDCEIPGYYEETSHDRGLRTLHGKLGAMHRVYSATNMPPQVARWDLEVTRGSIRRGNSGAPVIRSEDGKVVGVLSVRASGSGREGRVIDVRALRYLWTEAVFYLPHCSHGLNAPLETTGVPAQKSDPPLLESDALREHPVFQELASLIRRGRTITALGGGVLKEMGLPSSAELAARLRARAADWGVELPETVGVTGAAAVVARMASRDEVAAVLREALQPPWAQGTTGPAYRLLARMEDLTRWLVTTNWDDFIAQMIPGADVIHTCQDLNTGALSLARSRILKLRGSLANPKEATLTDVDHLALLEEQPDSNVELWERVGALARRRSCICLGFLPGDPELCLLARAFQRQIPEGQTAPPHFFVGTAPPPSYPGLDVRYLPAKATDFLLALYKELEEFANRRDELELIFGRQDKAFIEFHGYFNGKSALLDRAEQEADRHDWQREQILRINWDHNPDGPTSPLITNENEFVRVLRANAGEGGSIQTLEDFGAYLRNKGSVFLILDAMEHVRDQACLIRFLEQIVAPVIRDGGRRTPSSKLLMAGRYPLPQRKLSYDFRQSLLSHSLVAFHDSVVLEMAEKFLLATDPASCATFSDTLIADILDVSSGDATFIRDLLTWLTDGVRSCGGCISSLPVALSAEQKWLYVERFNRAVDTHVRWNGRADLKAAYETLLCAFRWLNGEIVNALQLDVPHPHLDLAEIYVIDASDFTADLVIRRTKDLYLKYHRPELYCQVHRRARDILWRRVQCMDGNDQIGYVVEWLFQLTHILLCEHPDEPGVRCERLLEAVSKLTYWAYPNELRGTMGHKVADAITNDLELWRLLEECVPTCRDEVLRILEDKEVSDVRERTPSCS